MILDAAYRMSDRQDLAAGATTFPATAITGQLSTNYADIADINWSGPAQYLHFKVDEAVSHDLTVSLAAWPDGFAPADALVVANVHRFLLTLTLVQALGHLDAGASHFLPLPGAVSAQVVPQLALKIRYLNVFILHSLSLTTGAISINLTEANAVQPKAFPALNLS